MKFGNIELFPIETGRFRLDGGAMFGVVPKNLWNATNPADESNRIELALRTLLVKKEDRVILVDTGLGDKLSQKLNTIYGVDFNRFTLLKSLSEIGIISEQITDVIITHLHFDHTGGAVTKKNDDLVPTFPNAKYYVQKRQWEWAQKKSERDRASYFPENYIPLYDHGVLNFTDGNTELFSGIHVIMLDGHTYGQQVVRIEEAGQSLLYCADLIPTTSHIPAPFIMGYDLQPIITLEEKHVFLDKAVKHDWLLYFEHDSVHEVARVSQNDRGYQAREKGALHEVLHT